MSIHTDPVYHWHHIVPRHAGGTDDPDNLVRLSVEEHAEAHRVLWEQYGRPQDKLAWLLLAGKSSEAEALRIAMASEVQKHRWGQPGAREAQSARMKGNTLMSGCVRNPHTEETKRKISDAQKARFSDPTNHPQYGKPRSEETKRKISEKKRGITLSAERRERLRQSNIGRPQTDYQKQRARDVKAAQWDIVTPDGERLRITNLRQFCKEHHLSDGNLITHGRTKGYTAQRV